ncbi:trypsin-like serine peptidase [Streptomyces orinoci]|uniref:Trypsin-like peptidase domain-containing protein n=1 Tax=Streptomyces orinoci TaxID=67339 RepID=A0ABV3JYK1_STRON|nr:trypsin-like peptidase domain-containing protein [Streptomyces orinoci]
MRISRIRGLILASVCGLMLPLGAAAANAAGPSPAPRPGNWSARDAIRYWTPQRIDSATPLGGRSAPPRPAAAPPHAHPDLIHDSSVHFPGLKSVGVLFLVSSGEKHHFCSASVVRSAGHDLILSAGHCVNGARAAFIPRYDGSKSLDRQPYGVFPVLADKWFKDPRYTANSTGKESDLDFSFARLGPNEDGRKVQDVVGGSTLARTPGAKNAVTVVGYPSVKHNSSDTPVRCYTRTGALPHYYQMRVDCAGMWGGVSGGPWFSRVDEDKGTGEIIGNVGGFNGGGPNVPDSNPLYNRLTYSPLHQDWFFRLYEDAQHGSVSRPDPYQQPQLPYSIGTYDTWKHARLMASGDFSGTGRDGLLVVWTDGEVTLYTGDGDDDFSGERQLVAHNGTWTHAETITAGDFAGSNQFDLLVRWSDGEVTLYPDVGSRGVNWDGIRLAAPGSVWKNATQIAAGRFVADTYVTDLMVRWVDGEVTLYTNTGQGGFGQEHQLLKPNSTWKDATLLTAGQYSGYQKWDLFVRWVDGELDTYHGITTSGLGTENRMADKNPTWTHASAITTGNFASTGLTTDLMVRWSDGETTIYRNTGLSRLGIEDTLVYPVL